MHVPPSEVASALHGRIALEAAQQGIVLLKNSQGALPLDKSAAHQASVALVGPLVNDSAVLLGNYFGVPPHIITPLDGVLQYTSAHLLQVEAGVTVAGNSTRGIPAAVGAARNCSVTVIVAGLDGTVEGEGLDRTSLQWPGMQAEMIAQVAAAAAPRPVVLVVLSGGPIDISSQRDNANISAILWAGYPGQAGGMAIAQALWGDVNPAGRLSTMVYPDSFVDTTGSNVSMTNMNFRPNFTTGYPGRTFRFFTGTPVFEFGHGLSYTTWEERVRSAAIAPKFALKHSTTSAGVPTVFASKVALRAWLAANTHDDSGVFAPAIEAAPSVVSVAVQIENTGNMAGDRVVLLFKAPPNAGLAGTPLQDLVAFERVSVVARTSQTLVLEVHARELTHINDEGARVVSLGVHNFAFALSPGEGSIVLRVSVE
jgi:beta-D-xylosidase 4